MVFHSQTERYLRQKIKIMPITNIGRIPAGSSPSGDFHVTDISKSNIQENETNYLFDLSWAPPAGGADRYLVEFYRTNTQIPGNLLQSGTVTGNSISLNVPQASTYSLKITSFRGTETSYVIIEEIIK